MKTRYFKSSVLFAAVALLFTACKSDRDDNPQLGPNHTAVQVGLRQNGSDNWGEFLETGFTTTSANLSGEEIAKVICKLDGFKTEDDYVDMGFREVIMRVKADIQNTQSKVVEGTEILSNTVSFNHMAAYCMIPSKGTLWVIGSCCGWPEPSPGNKQTLVDGGWFIMETEIGSNVFEGEVDMPEGDLTFRFYSKLTGWDGGDSYGFKVEDEATEITLTNGVYSGKGMTGKGSWTINGFPGGTMKLTVDKNNNTVKFELL